MEARKIHYGDGLEKMLADIFVENDINFIHESEDKSIALDFYLPEFDIYIEVKRFHADRISDQMKSRENVIAIQGIKCIQALGMILSKQK